MRCFFGIHDFREIGPTHYFLKHPAGELAEGIISRCSRCERARYEFIRYLPTIVLPSGEVRVQT